MMKFGNVISSPRADLTLQQALDLANMYLENATKTQDPVVTMVLCHDTEVSLNQARKATKTAEDQAKQEGIANAFSKLGNLLESRGHRTEAQAMLKKAKKLGGSVAEPVRQASTARPTSMATIMGNILDTSHNQKRRDSVMIPAQVFAENRRLSAMEFKPPEPDKRLNDTAQLACSLSLLQSPDDVVDPNARQWVLNTKGNQDEQERLKLLSTDLARTFKRDELKDPKAVAEVVYLTPVLGQSDFKHLLREFTTGIEHSSLLDNNQLEGLAQLLQNAAYPNYLDASELNKILVLINTRPRITHGQSQAHLYQLTLTISHVLDAIADIKVVGLNREMLAESLRTYLEGLMGSSDPYLVFQAAYAYQALQYIPDNDTLWKAALKRTARVQGISALMITTKGSDLNGFIEALGSIQQESAEVTFKSGYDNPTSLVESGQSFLACLKEGHSFTSKRAWYSALRGADSLLRDGQITEFKKVVCEASCRSDPAFQWGVCLRLNDLASNTMWDTDIRQGAIVFLGEMYRNDSSWGQYANIKQWILSILTNLSTHIGGEVQAAAKMLLQELEKDGDASKQALYKASQGAGPMSHPSRVVLPPLGSPSLLDRVQNRPDVEGNISQLKTQRLEEKGNGVYIPLQAKPGVQASDEARFPLMEKVKEFLNSDQKVFLLLGDSGSGKTTFNQQLEFSLWEAYKKKTGIIPLYIYLPTIDKPEHDMIAKQLRMANFTEPQIREMRHYRRFILICDGYDESLQTNNLYTSNRLNQPGEWNAQMMITSRSEYVGVDSRDRFWPDSNLQLDSSKFQEAVIAPFSDDQVQDYIERYVLVNQQPWQTEDYQRALDLIPNLKSLMENPFLMTLSLEVLPRMVDPGQPLSATRVTKMILYDQFVEYWLERSKQRLGETVMSSEARVALENLSNGGFTQNGIDFLKKLSVAIYKEQDGHPIVTYSRYKDEHSWKDEFFSRDDEKQFLREACPITRSGNQHQFIHRSLLEYGLALAIYDPQDRKERSGSHFMGRRGSASSTLSFEIRRSSIEASTSNEQELDPQSPLVWRSFVHEPSLLQFLEERVQEEPAFKQQLHSYIEQSKNGKRWRTAAANAITILVRAGVSFIEAELQNIQIPGADLSQGMFYSAQLQGADLRKTNLRGAWLQQADLNGSQMKGVQFGELPFLKAETMVMSCAFSPDEKSLAVGLYRSGVTLYTTRDWETIGTLTGHNREVVAVVYSPKGDQIATCSEDKTVRLWDADTRICRHVLNDHTSGVTGVAFSPSGDLVVSSSHDKTLRVWDTDTGACRATLTGHTDSVLGVAFSPNGNQIASASADKTVRLWDTESGACSQVLSGHRHWVYSVAYSPQGNLVASGSKDMTVRLWDSESGESHPPLTGHNNDVRSVVFSPQGNALASGSADKTIRLWDLETGACLQTFTGHTNVVNSITYSLKGDQIASSSTDQTVRLWEVGEARPAPIASSGHTDGVTTIVHSPKEGQIASSGKDGKIGFWDMDTGTYRFVQRDRATWVSSIAYSPQGHQLASGDRDGRVQLWDAETGACIRDLKGHTKPINRVLFSPQGDVVASVSDDETVRLWNVQGGNCIRTLAGHSGRVVNMVFSARGDRILSCSDDKTIRLWDVNSGNSHTFNGHTEQVISVIYSPVGNQAASAGDATVRLWDLQTGTCVHTLSAHRGAVRSIAYSPRGDVIVSASEDKTVRVWDVRTGACRHTLSDHTNHVTKVVFSPRGDMFASGSDDMTVRLWDVESGQCRAIIRNPHGDIRDLSWVSNSDGSFLALGCEDGSVWQWQVAGVGVLSRVRLCWKSADGRLAVIGASIQDARGLSQRNKQLLKQRGAEGEPSHRLREASKRLLSMASVASDLRLSLHRLSMNSLNSPLSAEFDQPDVRSSSRQMMNGWSPE